MNKKLDNFLAYSMVMLLATVGGGALGYLTQTGLIDVVRMEASDTHEGRRFHQGQASEVVTREEYRHRTSVGWWMGCLVGAGAGVYGVRVLRRT
jgi:hypothetical protein